MTDDAPVTTDEVPAAGEDPGTEAAVTRQLDQLLDDIYHGQERVSQTEIHRRALARDLPAELLTRISALPQGEYAADEAADLLGGSPA